MRHGIVVAMKFSIAMVAAIVMSTVAGAQQRESEPNDDLATANPVALGDTIVGAIDRAGDVDHFAIPLHAGTIIRFDVEAGPGGSSLRPYAVLWSHDGYQPFTFEFNVAGARVQMRHYVTVTDAHVLSIEEADTGSGPHHSYAISFDTIAPGPGDPTTAIFSGANRAQTLVAGAEGELYVLDSWDGDIWRVPPTGAPQLLTRTGANTWFSDMVLDGFGDLLVVTAESADVLRIRTSDGEQSRFATLASGDAPSRITVGPDADVWVHAWNEADGVVRFYRYSPYGVEKSRCETDDLGWLSDMAFSAEGVLHVTGYFQVRRRAQGCNFEVVYSTLLQQIEGITFDEQGNVYLTMRSRSYSYFWLTKLGPDYAVVADPFVASNPVGFAASAFLRDASGAMTSRLVAGNVVEVNAAGIAATGLRIGMDVPEVVATVADAAEHLLAGGILSAITEDFLDAMGNRNASFDIGDLRALVRAQEPISSAVDPSTDLEPEQRP